MTTSGYDEDRATTEAARWLVALEEDPEDEGLRADFAAWLAADPENPVAWAHTSDIYRMMATPPPMHAAHWAPYLAERDEARAVPSAAGGAVRPLRPRPRTRRLAFAAAAAALAACVALVLAPSLMLRLQADYVTATAETRSLRLADGSTVRLAPESAIEVAFAGSQRRVRLLKGEAFFEVTRDPGRPFQVASGRVETTVLGTAFDVRMGREGAAIAVRDGHVRVEYAGASPPVFAHLEPGDWISVGWNGRMARGAMPPAEAASWLHGQIVARDRPLAEIVDDLRRYYAGIIVLADDALGRQHVTGVYNVAEPVAALQAIVGAHGGAVRRISPWLLVVSGG